MDGMATGNTKVHRWNQLGPHLGRQDIMTIEALDPDSLTWEVSRRWWWPAVEMRVFLSH